MYRYACPNTNEWNYFQNHLKKTKRKPRKWLSRSEAAIIIQRAFRKYRKRKLLRILNRNVVRKFRPKDPARNLKQDRVLEMFTPLKNKLAKSHM
ncbi:hypothetical protein NQ314_005947 [Rhamnusium bicolor]|uniref:Uncharacterized protein n=1 Tax=Rhamnusium bicolor TaxID=1586634 RepID=A0AAV8ZAF9_9CUCU|nr:hypothetical protein NQ314_005947 [Rhamnusium bicolor]